MLRSVSVLWSPVFFSFLSLLFFNSNYKFHIRPPCEIKVFSLVYLTNELSIYSYHFCVTPSGVWFINVLPQLSTQLIITPQLAHTINFHWRLLHFFFSSVLLTLHLMIVSTCQNRRALSGRRFCSLNIAFKNSEICNTPLNFLFFFLLFHRKLDQMFNL